MSVPTLPVLIDRAVEISGHIKNKLDKIYYNGSNIQLDIRWQSTLAIKAEASCEPSLTAVERHVVTLSYGLIQELYSIAFEFSRFSNGSGRQDKIADIYVIPRQFDLMKAAELLFMAGVVFVIYHEIAHINQGHGAIRLVYSNNSDGLTISDFGIAGEGEISGDQAAISHATELAADFEALDWVASELEFFSGNDYLDHAYLYCGMISSIMLLFQGNVPVRLDAEPRGSHPNPGARMDLWVKAFAERTALLSKHLKITEDKSDIYKRLSDAAFMSILSWLNRNQTLDNPEYADFCKTISSDPNYANYMRRIIGIWSLHYEQAREARRYGGALSVLYFTDDFRRIVGADLNKEMFNEHLQKTLDAVT